MRPEGLNALSNPFSGVGVLYDSVSHKKASQNVSQYVPITQQACRIFLTKIVDHIHSEQLKDDKLQKY
jgi:hypothetical protein